MNSSTPYLTDPVMTILTLFIGSLIFVAVSRSLSQWGFFEGRTKTVMAVCVTVLCLIGMYQFIALPHQGTDHLSENTPRERPGWWHALLLPYAVLGIVALLLPILSNRSLRLKDERRRPKRNDTNRKIQTQRREMDRRRSYR